MDQENRKGTGLRFNSNKPRFDLLEPFAQLQQARIMMKGANKYAERNWEKGMKWSNCYASGMRHVHAFASGEDYDIDHSCPDCQNSLRTGQWTCTNHTGELHSALAAWNFNALTSYYKLYPQGDNRPLPYLNNFKIGLDIDEVLADWVHAWVERWSLGNVPTSWFFDRDIRARFDIMKNNGELDEFYLNLKPLTLPEEIPFEPECYVTSRPVPVETTIAWLDKIGFPARPVYTVALGESKVDVLKAHGVDIFVDDRYDNFVELNSNGVCCYLFDAPHNQRYRVGYKRLKSLKDLVWR